MKGKFILPLKYIGQQAILLKIVGFCGKKAKDIKEKSIFIELELCYIILHSFTIY